MVRSFPSAPLLALAVMAAAVPAWAASPQAWNAYGLQVQKSCLAASGLRNPRPAGERVDLPGPGDALSSALLVEGSYPQPHMAGRRGLELCLYDARSKQAKVGDADRMIRGSRQP
jgi:hypothetical protein